MTTRRDVLRAAPAALAAVAVPSVAFAGGENDAVLRRLWSEYLVAVADAPAVRAIYKDARAAYDAVVRPNGARPDFDTYCMDALYEEVCRPAWDAWNEADRRYRVVIDAIRATPAEGIVGLAIKAMAILPPVADDPEDAASVLDAVREDIVRLTGLVVPDLSGEGRAAA